MKYKSKQLKDLVFKAGNQHKRHKFIKCMKELKQLNSECLENFEDIDLENGLNHTIMGIDMSE